MTMATEAAVDSNWMAASATSNYSGLPMDRDANTWWELLFRLQMNDIDHTGVVVFIRRTWLVSVYSSAAYLVLLYLCLKWMQTREAFNLRLPLAVWSGALCLFSFLGTIAVWPEFISLARNKGFVATYCDNSYREDQQVMYWYTIFVISKLAELVDTAFIVLRKQKLITLHWVHHVLTLIYCFYVYRDEVSTARWMVAMNFAVHTAMYGYYCLKALRVSIPRPIAQLITTGQIVQMIFGFYINIHTLIYALSSTPERCQCSLRASISGFLLYALFFYFFVQFFVNAYLGKSSGKGRATSKVSNGECKKNQPNLNGQPLKSDLNNNEMHLLSKKEN